MPLSRIHVDQSLQAGSVVALSRDQAHYVHRVLRLGQDDVLNVFNSRDGEFSAIVESVLGSKASVRIEAPITSDMESPLVTTLVQGLCRSQRMDYCVQKACELGVTRIVPVRTERSVVRLDERRASKRRDHWQAIAVSACEQSGRIQVPLVEMPASLTQVLQRHDLGGRALLDPDAGDAFDQWQFDGEELALMIGPEGGFSPAEVAQTLTAGASRWRMGPRILRTETAGMVALAMAQTRWGDLGR